jgi:hypothetical protein
MSAPPSLKRVPLNKIENRKDFLSGLAASMTFLEACEYSGNDPELLTRIIQTNPEFHSLCRDKIRESAQVYLDLADGENKAGRYQKAVEARTRAKEHIGRMGLWGHVGKLSEMNTDQVMRAIRGQNGNMKEAANAMACSYAELEQYLTENDLHDLVERLSRKRNW